MTRLLVVEDDENIGGLLDSGLTEAGYEVSWHRTGAPALAEATHDVPDLVLLDLGLPDVDGVELCRELRRVQPGTIIVMLTARSEEMDVVTGLESGADDYLVKPFGMVELLARIRAHLRRGSSGDAAADDVIELGDLRIDLAAHACFLGDQEVALRAKEFDLLLRLAQSPGAAVTRESLMADVWDENWWGSTKTLDVHIASLRRKLATPADGVRAPVITTLRGHGYRLEAPDPTDAGA